MDTRILEEEFLNCDLSSFEPTRQWFSSKFDDRIMPPYVPWVGSNYEQGGVLIYGTAQNLIEAWVKQWAFASDPIQLVRRLLLRWQTGDSNSGFQDVSIHPYSVSILPSLAGVLQYIRFGSAPEDLIEIHNQVAATNYYKFSLRNGRRDLNPNGLADDEFGRDYLRMNDSLVRRELEILNPGVLIAIRGRHSGLLAMEARESGRLMLEINDPAWILRGGGGCFRENGSWYNKANTVIDAGILKLVKGWVGQIPEWAKDYRSKAESVRIYLLCYYVDWSYQLKR